MDDVEVVQGAEPVDELDEYSPDFSLWEASPLLCECLNLLLQVTVVYILHHNIE